MIQKHFKDCKTWEEQQEFIDNVARKQSASMRKHWEESRRNSPAQQNKALRKIQNEIWNCVRYGYIPEDKADKIAKEIQEFKNLD